MSDYEASFPSSGKILHQKDYMIYHVTNIKCLRAKIQELKDEFTKYFTKCADVSPAVDVVNWWCKNSKDLPNWSKAAKLVMLIQPSSAVVERVFSMLTSSFNPEQSSALEDYQEASIMLQFNKRN